MKIQLYIILCDILGCYIQSITLSYFQIEFLFSFSKTN